MKQQKTTKIMVTCALLVALQVILARFLSINTTFVVVNFSFLAVALAGILFGPLWGMAGGVSVPLRRFFPRLYADGGSGWPGVRGVSAHQDRRSPGKKRVAPGRGSFPERQPDPLCAQQRMALHHVWSGAVRHAARAYH